MLTCGQDTGLFVNVLEDTLWLPAPFDEQWKRHPAAVANLVLHLCTAFNWNIPKTGSNVLHVAGRAPKQYWLDIVRVAETDSCCGSGVVHTCMHVIGVDSRTYPTEGTKMINLLFDPFKFRLYLLELLSCPVVRACPRLRYNTSAKYAKYGKTPSMWCRENHMPDVADVLDALPDICGVRFTWISALVFSRFAGAL